MLCKDVQTTISSGEGLSEAATTHVASCPACSEHARFSQEIDAFLPDLRISAPAGLRSKIWEKVGTNRPVPLRAYLVAGAIVLLIAIPIEPFLAMRLTHRSTGISGKIGDWPTYHSVTERYQLVTASQSPKGATDEVDEEWVKADAARFIRKHGRMILEDIVIKDEGGLPVKFERTMQGDLIRTPDGNGYYYTPEGKVKQDLAAAKSFSPFCADLRWAVDIPRNFSRLKTSTVFQRSRGSWLVPPYPDMTTTVVSASGDAKVLAELDRSTGKIFGLQHFGTIYDEQGRVAIPLTMDYSVDFDYKPAPSSVFDPASIQTPAVTVPATPAREKPAP